MTGRGLVNLRDVGGLPLLGKGATAHGILYRGDAPYPGDSVIPEIALWPPKSVIDLRGARERARFAYEWPVGTSVHHVPLSAAAAPDAQPSDLPVVYARMIDRGSSWVGELLDLVTQPEGPVLLHCTAGKDRTGVAVAVLLLAAGVRPEAVVDDYARTERTLPDLMARWFDVGVRTAKSPPLPEQYMHAPSSAIEPIVERITATRGGPAQWMLDHGADPVLLDMWRTRLHGVPVPALIQRAYGA